MNNYQDATFYVQVEPQWSTWRNHNGEHNLIGAKAVALTQKRPTGRQKPGTIMTKMTMRIPNAAFLPLRPEAIVVIPEDMVVAEPIEAIAEDPNQ